VRTALAAGAVAALAAACSSGGSAAGRPATDGAGSPLEDRVTVLAASSMTDVLGWLAAGFEDQHPGTEVALSFGGSSTLAQQVVQGAPADVLVTASEETRAPVAAADLVRGTPQVVATNVLELAVPRDNPGGVRGLADLAEPGLRVALCAPQVPCGAVSAEVLDRAGVTAAPDTLEQDVRAVLSKVELGEVDAGLVYATDVRAGGDAVRGIDVPQAAQVPTSYPVAVLAEAPHPRAAAAFADLLASPQGRAALHDAGFSDP
jgi:molybdate transport system substrate-binding protein